MVRRELAEKVFRKEAMGCGFIASGYLCFEEDNDAQVALRELMDKGLFTAPVNYYWKPGEYEKCINECVQRYYPEYWQARKASLADMGAPADPPAKRGRERER